MHGVDYFTKRMRENNSQSKQECNFFFIKPLYSVSNNSKLPRFLAHSVPSLCIEYSIFATKEIKHEYKKSSGINGHNSSNYSVSAVHNKMYYIYRIVLAVRMKSNCITRYCAVTHLHAVNRRQVYTVSQKKGPRHYRL